MPTRLAVSGVSNHPGTRLSEVLLEGIEDLLEPLRIGGRVTREPRNR